MSNSNSNSQTLDQNYNILLNERAKIQKIEKESATLNAANKDTQLVVTQHYSKYVVLVFVTLLLVLLILKFAITGGEQTGGGGNNFVNEAIFLLILMIVSIGLAPVINNLNAYVFLTLIIISYIVIKMKMININ
jgi:hypothetical protein